YGYVKYCKKSVKKRTRERMSDQEAKEIKAEDTNSWNWMAAECSMGCSRLRHDLSGFGFDFFSFLITHPFSCSLLTVFLRSLTYPYLHT
ncbi:hypothetical protein Tco_1355580, partial [Tanacetum coccineum]